MSAWLVWLGCSGAGGPCAPGGGANCSPSTTTADTGAPTAAPTDVTETDAPPAHSAEPRHSAPEVHTGGPPFTGPVLVTSASVACVADVAEVRVETQAWSGGGFFYQIESGVQPPWAEEHDLVSFEFDPRGAWDHLKVDLQTGVSLGAVERSVSTLFTCADHYDRAGIMTFAVAATDLYGEVADCLAWGDDPAGVIAGTVLSPYNYAYGPTFDASLCAAGIVPR